jgi:hypothetical protein
VAILKYGEVQIFGKDIKKQNCIHKEIMSRLNMGNACYHSVQNILPFHLLSKNIKIIIYKTIILPVVLYGCEMSLALRGKRRLKGV